MLYAPPTVKDMAVCVVIFRPVQWARTANNFMRLVAELASAQMPLFIAELVRPGEEAITGRLNDAQKHTTRVWVFSSEHVLFHKENLQNLLADRVPVEYQKLCFLDADVLFTNPHWYMELSQKLNAWHIVQPMDWCEWLDVTDRPVMAENMHGKIPASMLLQLGDKMRIERAHPGFAWAFQRDVFQQIHGFYERQPVGSGDTAFVCALSKDTEQLDANAKFFAPHEFAYVNTPSYQNYRALVQKISPTVSYLSGNTARHLYHGPIAARGYSGAVINATLALSPRHHHLPPVNPDTNEYPFNRRGDGILEWNDERLKHCLLPYFQSRDEDS